MNLTIDLHIQQLMTFSALIMSELQYYIRLKANYIASLSSYQQRQKLDFQNYCL